jgi:hypothetical protein
MKNIFWYGSILVPVVIPILLIPVGFVAMALGWLVVPPDLHPTVGGIGGLALGVVVFGDGRRGHVCRVSR